MATSLDVNPYDLSLSQIRDPQFRVQAIARANAEARAEAAMIEAQAKKDEENRKAAQLVIDQNKDIRDAQKFAAEQAPDVLAAEAEKRRLGLVAQQNQVDLETAKIADSKRKDTMQLAGSDFMQWMLNAPDQYKGKSFMDAPPEVRDYGINAYGDAKLASDVWNETAREVAGNPMIGRMAPPSGSKTTVDYGTKGEATVKMELPQGVPSEEETVKPNPKYGGMDVDTRLKPEEIEIAKAVADERIGLNQISRFGNKKPMIMAQVFRFNPAYDETNYNNRKAVIKGYTSSEGVAAKSIQSLNLAISHLHEWENAHKKLGTTNPSGSLDVLSKSKNKLKVAIMRQASNPDLKAAEAARVNVGHELAKLFKGSATSEGEVHEFADMLDAAMSPAEREKIVQLFFNLIAPRVGSLHEAYQQAVKDPSGKRNLKFFFKHTREVMEEMGKRPQDIDPLEPEDESAPHVGSNVDPDETATADEVRQSQRQSAASPETIRPPAERGSPEWDSQRAAVRRMLEQNPSQHSSEKIARIKAHYDLN